MNDSHTADLHSPALLKVWEEYAAACQTMFERLSDSTFVTGGGAIPFEFLAPWKDFAESLGMRTDFAAGEQFKPDEVFAGLMPALGISREYQEIGRRMQELTVQFQRRYAEFAQQGVDIGQNALQSFQKRTSSGEATQPSSAALYDAWIDSAEEAYARAAHGETFARLLADLCNILSAFKVERGKLLEALARQLDWPSRAEVDSLHRRVLALTSAINKPPPPKARGSNKPKAPQRKGSMVAKSKFPKVAKSKFPKVAKSKFPKVAKSKAHQPKVAGPAASRPPKRAGR